MARRESRCARGAYALSRPQLKGRRFFNLFIAFTMWFKVGLIPFFLNMRDLNLLDSLFAHPRPDRLPVHSEILREEHPARRCEGIMKTQIRGNQMRKLGLATALLAGSAMTTSAFADGHLRIVEEPLELTIQMNHARYPVYEENWPVEQAARKMTGIHLINDTVGANMRTDENTGRTEALNPMLA